MSETSTALVSHQNAVEMLLALEREGCLDAVSLSLTDPEMPYERWSALGVLLGTIDRGSRWWIGDWLTFGEDLYGEDSSQALESTPAERYDIIMRVTGMDEQTLRNISSICRRVARARRRSELGFWIHAEVAALTPAEQTEWLDRTIENGWHRSDLRDAIRAARSPGADPGPDDEAAPVEGEPRLSVGERIEQAARAVWHTGQSTSDGSVLVPAESWAKLAEALGEER